MIWLEHLSDKITQGSIIDGIKWNNGLENYLGIVLSNACDFENADKLGYIIVSALIPAKETLQFSKQYKDLVKSENLSEPQKKALKRFLENYIHNKEVTRYYFIDSEPVFEGGLFLVDFQIVQSVPNKKKDVEVIAQLKHPFIEQLMMRFVSYTARIPSDRVDEETKKEYFHILSDNLL
jgi:hypothetical protein